MKDQNKRLGMIIGYLIYKGLVSYKSTQKDISSKIDMDYTNISKAMNEEGVHLRTFISKTNKSFNDIFNEDWLFTGEGEMLKIDNSPTIIGDSNLTNAGDNNSISVGGSVVNVALPPEGKYKIIKPDGTVELHSVAPINPNLRNIEELEAVLKMKDEVIKAKDDLIEILKQQINNK